MKSLTLHITGMSCGHCLNAVTSALSQLEGVQLKTTKMGRADLEFDPEKISPVVITAAIEDAGYSAVAVEG